MDLTANDFPQELKNLTEAFPAKTTCKGISGELCGEAGRLGAACAGVLNGDTNEPLTDSAVFWGDQLAAPVLAYLTFLAVKEGLLDPDRPLCNYLSSAFLPGEAELIKVTARHVLTHQSGFPETKATDGLPTKMILPPSVRVSFSRYAQVYLQRALEQVTGKKFQDLAAEWIFTPFRMASSSFVWRDDYEGRFASPHKADGTPELRVRAGEANCSKFFYTTPHDYCLFLHKLITPQTSAKCLPPLLLEQMLAPQAELYRDLFVTHGFYLSKKRGVQIIASRREETGALAFIDRENGRVGCVFVNDRKGNDVCRQWMKTVYPQAAQAYDDLTGLSMEKTLYSNKTKSLEKRFRA